MKIKISTLRRIIREEMYRNLEWTAGIASGGAGLNKPSRGIKYGVPQGLGFGDLEETEGHEERMENKEERYEEESSDRYE